MTHYYPSLETDRLLLRGFTTEDAATVCRLAGDPRISGMCLHIPYPYPEEQAIAWISQHPEWYTDAKQVIFAVCQRKTDEIIGACGLGIEQEDARAEIGYWIGVSFQGKGYATEAVRAIIGYGFTALNLNKVTASCFCWNTASLHVMKKNGMNEEGLLRRQVKKEEEFEDLIVCGILREEWEERTGRSSSGG